MSISIQIDNLYKEYRLGTIGRGTLYRDLQSWWAKVKGKEDPNSIIGFDGSVHNKSNILALDNINLTIKQGQILGVIGANGAGKSTLLKILSRVTAPTRGVVKIKGRIASLLEVGTGFHPELTGRDNIYLNGAINGMNRREVTKRLDEIVSFAGVNKFLDTPVKRYSSGMYVRLGFSVAAHLEPDILVVDEVLAVGDVNFQKKAIGKIKDVNSKKGRTVLFVSHNMQSIRQLCERAILLDKGKLVFEGKSNTVVDKYLVGMKDKNINDLLKSGKLKRDKNVNGAVKFTDCVTKNMNGINQTQFENGDNVCYYIEYEVLKNIDNLYLSFGLLSSKTGEPLGIIKKTISEKPLAIGKKGKFNFILNTSSIKFGEFGVNVLLHGHRVYEDYDFLSNNNLPPLHIISKTIKRSQKGVTSLFNIDSTIEIL